MATKNYGAISNTYDTCTFMPAEGRWWIHAFRENETSGSCDYVFVDNFLDYHIAHCNYHGFRGGKDITSIKYIQKHTQPLTDDQIDTVQLINVQIPEYTDTNIYIALLTIGANNNCRTRIYERIYFLHESINASMKRSTEERLEYVEKFSNALKTRFQEDDATTCMIKERLGTTEERLGIDEERLGATEERLMGFDTRFEDVYERLGVAKERIAAIERSIETSIRLSINSIDRSCRNLEAELAEERRARKQFQYYLLIVISLITAVLALRR